MKATNDMTNTSGTRRTTGWSCACLLLLAGQATAQPGGQPPMIRAIPIVRMPAAQPPEPPEEGAKAGDGESPVGPVDDQRDRRVLRRGHGRQQVVLLEHKANMFGAKAGQFTAGQR